MAVYTHCCRAQPLRQLGFLVNFGEGDLGTVNNALHCRVIGIHVWIQEF